MPHQCVRCSTFYPDGAEEILKGCSCGARLFFYIKKKDLDYGKELVSSLSEEDKETIEKDIGEILHVKDEDANKPVVLDIEAIRVLKPGKYELDLVHLFKKDPLIIKLEEGKYMIDLPQAFKRKEEK
ncbi:MAG: Zn-ribbon domain-containing protein [Nanoarchaeota archaeon]|nr:Zn-ribbon domain-containing protein [Nanoarchaeota archaeon]MBU1643755.1 Zn-ribbon domain-containing protein [Nanoarchaeota archaeon]MBU1977110.1 Zn-ribbon domain-containing protein [Nanoarchaeota archaeon]